MKTQIQRYYKLAKTDGYDFRTGNTINYREAIGKTVTVPTFGKYGAKPKYVLCSDMVLHACQHVNDCFVGASIPCSVFVVEGKPVVKDDKKCGFTKLTVIEEIPFERLDEVFGWKYSVAVNPINPFKLPPTIITNTEITLLRNWDSVRESVRASIVDSVWASVGDSVRASVGDSVRASVGDSVRASVGDSVRASIVDSVRASVGDSVWDSVGDSVWDSVGDSVRASVGDSVWDSVGDSVRASVWASIVDSVWAYIGSIFSGIKRWKYVTTNIVGYPFQSAVDLWHKGLVPSFDGETWRLHSAPNGKIVYEITKAKLMELKV